MANLNAVSGSPVAEPGNPNLLPPALPDGTSAASTAPVGDTRIAVAVVDDAVIAGVCLVGAGLLLKALYDFETAVGSDGKTASQVRAEIVTDVAGKIHALFKNTVGFVSDNIPSLESLKASIGRGFADAGGGLGNAKASAERLMKQILGMPDGGVAQTPTTTPTKRSTPQSAATSNPPQPTPPVVRSSPKTATRPSPAPTTVVNRPVPVVTPLPVVRRNGSTNTRPADAAASERQTAAAAAASKQAGIDQAAVDTLSRATPLTQQLNAAVKSFYQEASGGRAARSNHSMTASLQTAAELRRQLSDVIADSNSLVAASSANHPTLDSWRNNLVQSRKAIDVWLKNANAYAAGLTGPGGKPTATPTLPLPPKVVLSTPGSKLSAAQEAAAIQQGYDSANAVLQRTAVKPVSAAEGAGGMKTPKLELVTRMPASVKYTAPVWVNVTTGEASATARSGSDWLKGTVGTPAMPMSDGSSNGVAGARKPPTGTYNLNQFFFQPEQDPDPKKKVNLAAIATGVFVLSSAGGLAFSVYQHVRSESTAREDRAEAAWQPNVALQAMPVKGELPSTNAQGAQIVATWQHFLGQAPAVLRANGASDKSVAAFQAASTAFINGQLLPVQAQLQRTTDPKAKSQLLQAMANLKFPALSVAVDPADPKAARTTKTLAVVAEAIKDGVNNSLSLILNSAAVPKPPAATPTVKAAPPTQQQAAPAVTPLAPKETAQQQQARLKALVDRATPQGGAAVVPAPVVTPPTVATQAPKTQPPVTTATVPSVAPTATRPAPPVTAKPTPPDSKAALDRIGKLVANAGLTNPPATGRLSDIKFTREMFIAPVQQGDASALLAAIGQARKLFDAVGEVWKTSSPAVREEINRGPWASINAVLGDLTHRYNNAKPAAPTESPGTPDAVPAEPTPSPRPSPTPSPTPVSEPAMP